MTINDFHFILAHCNSNKIILLFKWSVFSGISFPLFIEFMTYQVKIKKLPEVLYFT